MNWPSRSRSSRSCPRRITTLCMERACPSRSFYTQWRSSCAHRPTIVRTVCVRISPAGRSCWRGSIPILSMPAAIPRWHTSGRWRIWGITSPSIWLPPMVSTQHLFRRSKTRKPLNRPMDVRKRLTSISTEKLVLSGLILLGFVLRLRQYLSGRALWLDEAMLALNIVGRSSSGLIQPLDYQPGGPPVFLLAEKLVITLLGNRELTLRLVPFLAGCAALLFFALLLRQMTGKAGTYIALALFAVGASPVYYASEVKQYSSDVFVALLLFWLAARHLHISARGRDFILLGVSGALACWCAHPAVFVLAGTGMTLLLHYALQKDGQRLKQMAIVIAVWTASFSILYFTNLRGLASDQFLLNYWGDTFLTPTPGMDLSWIPDTLKGVLYDPVGLGATWMLAALLMLIGLLALLRRNWQFAAFFVLTFCALVVASALDKYPFVGRLLLFAA